MRPEDDVVGDVLQAEADATERAPSTIARLGEVDAERADADEQGHRHAEIVQPGIDRPAQRQVRRRWQHAIAHHAAQQAVLAMVAPAA